MEENLNLVREKTEMKITYFYIYGRKNRLHLKEYAKEMFYGYHEIKNKYPDTQIIEYRRRKSKYIRYIDKVVSKLFDIPFYLSEVLYLDNLKRCFKSDKIIFSNDRIMVSMAPVLLIIKIFKKNLQINVFVMGLIRHDENKSKLVRRYYLRLVHKVADNFIFLGQGEYNVSKKFFKNSTKLHFIPFYIDEGFWKTDIEDKRDGILFIGNDGNREFDKVIKICNHFKNIHFTVITKHIKQNQFKHNNVTLLNGSWGNKDISDGVLRDYYNRAKLVIIPLKNSMQPSGQSVALQSMSMKAPVMISKTDGFWDMENFENEENIIFLKNNSLENWIYEIENKYKNNDLLSSISDNAVDTIQNNYTSEIFNHKLSSIFNI